MKLASGEVTLGTKPGTVLKKSVVAEVVDRAGLTLLGITPPATNGREPKSSGQ
jgi:hypothetical protein